MQYERAHMVAPACHGGRRFDRARRTASRRRAPGSEKRNPAKAGIKFVHFGGILQTAGDRGGSGSRLASPCPVRRTPGARGSNRDINCNLPTAVANVTDCPSNKVVREFGRDPQAGPVASHIKNAPGSTRCGTSRIGAPCRSLARRVTAAVGRSPALCTAAPKSGARESI
jgi:hypothetical protein